MSLRQHDTVIATFAPQRTDDLQNGAAAHIGWRGRWYAAWRILRGPYKGQLAMTPFETNAPLIGWAPLCDLSNVERDGT